jgi:hypothetical protein
MKLVSDKHIHVKILNGSTLCACGNQGEVIAHNINGEGDLQEVESLCIYCAKCAAERVPELPICDWQQIVALSPPGTKRKSEWRKYKVHSLNEPSKRAILVIIDGSNQFLCGQTRIVRSDALSPTSRAIDAAFQIGGTALEIRFFENSDQR